MLPKRNYRSYEQVKLYIHLSPCSLSGFPFVSTKKGDTHGTHLVETQHMVRVQQITEKEYIYCASEDKVACLFIFLSPCRSSP